MSIFGVHRYDLSAKKWCREHPIDDVMEKIQQTLASGNRFGLSAEIKLPGRSSAPLVPPAPNANAGWDNVAYSDAWMEQPPLLFASTVSTGKMFRAIARPDQSI